MALVQADIWVKRGAAGDIYELEPLLAVPCLVPLSLKLMSHTLNNSVLAPLLLKSVSSVTKERYVSAQSHFRVMDGKSRKLDSAKGVVDTPICAAGPRAPLLSNLDDPEEWELTIPTATAYVGMKRIASVLLLVAPSSTVERRVVPGLVRHLWWDVGIQRGRSQTRAGFVGRLTGFLGMFCLVHRSETFGDVEKEVFTGGRIGPLGDQRAGSFLLWLWQSISSVPVSAVGGTSGPAVISSFSAEVTAQSAQKCDKHARVIW